MDEKIIDIEKIKKFINKRKINWTRHCLNRMNQRDILISDVKKAINNGKVIEYYYKDYPYPSCLILGKDLNDRNIHIVCGIDSYSVYMITVYYPDSDRWEKSMENRRGE